jgi:membrane protease YdiL (CAAX protease family)
MLSQKPWRAEAVIQLVAGVFACVCLGVLLVAGLRQAGVPAFKGTDGFASVLVATQSFQGAACGLMVLFLRFHGVGWREAFGLRTPGLMKSLLFGAVVLVVAFPVVVALQQLSGLALTWLGWHPDDQRAVDLLVNAKSTGMRAYLVFFAVVLAPVGEEFIFRGVLFPFFRQLGWPRLAWLGVSLLFALIHLNLPTLVPLFVLALVLAWLYDRTDRLLVPIAAHSLFNAANLAILFLQTR